MADLDVLLADRGLGVAPYLGFASVRGLVNDAVASSGSPMQRKCRIMDIARAPMKRPRVLWAVGWYVNSSGVEVVQAGTYGLQVAIEYPIGSTPVRVQIGGQATAAPAGGDTVITDDPGVDINIPEGALFIVHVWESSPNGYCYHNNYPGLAGDDLTGPTTTVPDLAAGYLTVGSAAPGAVGHVLLGVVDTITKAADLDIGDSICQGSGTDQRDIGGAFGVLARMTRGAFGGCNAGKSSTRASQFTGANRPRTIALATYASRVKCNFGVNDCLNSATAAATATELIRIRNLFSTKQFYQATIAPIVTGTTVLADGSDQTVGAPGTTATTLNTLIRAGLVVASGGKTPAPTITGVLDVRNVVQYPTNEEKWDPGFCGDAGDPDVHPTGRAYRLIGETCPGRSALFN